MSELKHPSDESMLLPLKSQGKFSLPTSSREMSEEDELMKEVLKYQEEQDKKKPRIGPDRMRKFDDIFASQINVGTKN